MHVKPSKPFENLLASIEDSTKESTKFKRPPYLLIKMNAIMEELSENVESLNTERWTRINQECLDNERYLITNHWPTPIFVKLVNQEMDPGIKLKIADWMIEQMDKNKCDNTAITMAAYMVILSQFGFCVKESEIMERYATLCAKTNNLFEPNMANFVMRALAQTKHWKENYKIHEYLKIFGVANMTNYDNIIVGAVVNGQYHLIWDILDLYRKNNTQPRGEIFKTVVEHSTMSDFHKLVSIMKEHNWVCDHDTALLISEKIKDR